MNQPITQIPDPNLRDVLNAHRREIFAALNCHQVGEIVSFNNDLQTATVKIAVNKQVVDYTKSPPEYVYKPYPLLTDCPVFMIGGGENGYLTFPVRAGDTCLILFNDRDLDNWFAGGANTPPNSSRLHDLSDGLVMVGFRNKANAIQGFDADHAILAYKGGTMKVGDKLAFDAALTNLRSVLEKVVDALSALNSVKTGGNAGTEIIAVTTEINKLLE